MWNISCNALSNIVLKTCLLDDILIRVLVLVPIHSLQTCRQRTSVYQIQSQIDSIWVMLNLKKIVIEKKLTFRIRLMLKCMHGWGRVWNIGTVWVWLVHLLGLTLISLCIRIKRECLQLKSAPSCLQLKCAPVCCRLVVPSSRAGSDTRWIWEQPRSIQGIIIARRSEESSPCEDHKHQTGEKGTCLVALCSGGSSSHAAVRRARSAWLHSAVRGLFHEADDSNKQGKSGGIGESLSHAAVRCNEGGMAVCWSFCISNFCLRIWIIKHPMNGGEVMQPLFSYSPDICPALAKGCWLLVSSWKQSFAILYWCFQI